MISGPHLAMGEVYFLADVKVKLRAILQITGSMAFCLHSRSFSTASEGYMTEGSGYQQGNKIITFNSLDNCSKTSLLR